MNFRCINDKDVESLLTIGKIYVGEIKKLSSGATSGFVALDEVDNGLPGIMQEKRFEAVSDASN